MLIALLPVGGVSLCLGGDGHVGLGAASADAASADAASVACPCGHLEAERGVLPSEDPQLAHPDCVDLLVDPPEVFRDADLVCELPSRELDPDADTGPWTTAGCSWWLAGVDPERLWWKPGGHSPIPLPLPPAHLRLQRIALQLI